MSSIRQSAERYNNISSVIDILRNEKKLTRNEIMNRLALSWGCVSELVTYLVKQGIVVEEKVSGGETRGRTPTVVTLSGEKRVLGVDINKTGLSLCVSDLFGKPVSGFTKPLDCSGKEPLLMNVIREIEKIREEYPQIIFVCFAMQGIRNGRTGVWSFPSDGGVEIKMEKELFPYIDLPAIVEHDPNCMLFSAINEFNKESKMLLRIDNGIGAAIYKNGRFLDEELLEFGYVITDNNGKTLSEVIRECCVQGIPNAEKIKKAGELLGVALANFSNLVVLDEIIVSGDFVKYKDLFLEPLKEEYAKYTLAMGRADITVKDIRNASYGAAKIALNKLTGAIYGGILK